MNSVNTLPYAIDWAQSAPKGSTVYCVLRHVSRSSMMRVIDLVVIDNGDVRYLRSLGDDERWPYKMHLKHDGFTITGTGMDMGFKIVYDLGLIFHGDGYYFNHRWL